jgi:uncharacterized membrane protein YvlD (DUF360 family)
MYYLKTLMFNFFVVFFANHIMPGIDVVNQTKLPHIGGDLIYAIALGFINSLIYPLLKVFNQATVLKIAGLSLVVNFIAYAILKLLPIGIHVTSFTGYFSAALLVSFGGFILNVFEMKYKKHRPEPMATGPASGDFPSVPPGTS